ncbi:MAG: MFS transporter [Propionibacteriaceae bacterium]
MPKSPRTALEATPGGSLRKIVSWAMWDWGTQPFNAVITTFIFSVYITSSAFGSGDGPSQALAFSTTIAGFLVALLAPVLGQRADRQGSTVSALKWQTWALAFVSAALWWVKPSPGYLWIGLILLGIGSLISEIACVNYNALLEEVATDHNVGRISGFGWGLGYLGGIFILLLLNYAFIAPEHGLFGVSNNDATNIRASMVVCAVWILLFTLPTFLNLRDRTDKPDAHYKKASPVGIIESYRLLGQSLLRLWKTSRHTVWFLLASALFRDGLAGVFAFGAVLAAGTFDFSGGEVIMFGAAANVIAGIGTILFGLLDDKIGPKKVILLSLASLVFFGLVVFFGHDQGKTLFWICGMGMTAFVGPAQAASRSFLARLIPEGKSGEVFGLYATTGRAISFLSPLAFGLAIALGKMIHPNQNSQYWGILGIVLILAAGLIVLIPVKEHNDHVIS